ncbi:MAG: site-2 protease family protein [Patescibacteria group bacterium]
MELIFALVILIVSVILHEVAHGYMANYLGDPTARLQGRLTLNPISHIDPLGSIILPAILVFTHSPILIGYAKPVPYNPYNLPGKYDETLVAFAGPGTNIFLALLFGLGIRFFGGALDPALVDAFSVIVYINMLLALFNLIPVPPLDGSKILSGILPRGLAARYDQFRFALERLGVLSGTLLILMFFYVLSPFFGALLGKLFTLLTGVSI